MERTKEQMRALMAKHLVYEFGGVLYIRADHGDLVPIGKVPGLWSAQVVGSEEYAEVALDFWQPSKKLSDEIRPLLPTSADLRDEMRRFIPDGVELMPNAHQGKHFVLASDPDRLYTRKKFYVRVFLEHEYVIGRSVDHVRRACFDGAKLVGEHLALWVDGFRAGKSPTEMPLAIRFTGEPMMLPQTRWDSGEFAAHDPMSDRTAIHFMTYFVVTPAGNEAKEIP